MCLSVSPSLSPQGSDIILCFSGNDIFLMRDSKERQRQRSDIFFWKLHIFSGNDVFFKSERSKEGVLRLSEGD